MGKKSKLKVDRHEQAMRDWATDDTLRTNFGYKNCSGSDDVGWTYTKDLNPLFHLHFEESFQIFL